MPLAAVTGRAEMMDAVHVGGLGGTYGGNPVACAAALATIESMGRQDAGGVQSCRRIPPWVSGRWLTIGWVESP
jgi:4-aminobutyrate aminotransferase/(S)-3-amino-2-methylpropionate transaminase